ncbi:hypothetical protein [Streptomyces sp. KL116D]|uniref:hypothetical protein n=1 Tax=Streptomyces sp. KL116D TaxID=3045152 RepID=UPI003557F241
MENRAKHPLVTTHLLKRRATWSLLLSTMLTMTGVFAIMNGLLPVAQDTAVGLGLGAQGATWWTLTPYALAGLAMGPSRAVSRRRTATAASCASAWSPRPPPRCWLLLTLHTGSSGLPPHLVDPARRDLRGHGQHHAQRSGHPALPAREPGLPAGPERGLLQPGRGAELRRPSTRP